MAPRTLLHIGLTLGLLLPANAFAESSRPTSEKLLQAEQSILSSLSARAVAFTEAPAPQRAAQPVMKNTPVSSSGEDVNEVQASNQPTSGELQSIQAAPKKEARELAKSASAKTPPLENTSQLRTANALLRSQLEQRELQVTTLTKQVQELQSQLTIAEVEVERLSAVMDAKTRVSLGQYKLAAPARPKTSSKPEVDATSQAPSIAAARDVQPPAADNNLEVATVAVQKAELRLGPGANHSALLSLPQGSRLAVEMRQGPWLRVFAPSGERAWIHASLVSFGDSAGRINSNSAVAVKGVAGAAEDEAFRRVKRGSAAE
jgi:hypothetical protein